MLELKTTETLKPNTEILELIKDYTYKVKKGVIKHINDAGLSGKDFMRPISTVNGEMIFGMNLVFGQRQRKKLEQEQSVL